jgi:SAM-dependent methyltransferase
MIGWFIHHRLCGALCFVLSAGIGAAQDPPGVKKLEPRVGQAGKDVVWVPTPQALVDKMLDVAKVTPNDYVIDLGSGDGRMVIAAAKRGARALGIEYNPDMVELSRRNAAKAGVVERASFVQGDIFASDLSKATVITLFLLADINLKLRPKILDLPPGTRIVSNTFTMGAWTADRIVTAEEDCPDYCVAYFWIVPAKVEGRWQLPQGEILFRQTFQKITGTVKSSAGALEIRDGTIEGSRISFSAGDRGEYVGHIAGNRIDGVARTGAGIHEWTAIRSTAP